jgi:hypothetical protein
MASHAQVTAYARRLARAYNIPPQAALAAVNAYEGDFNEDINWRETLDTLMVGLRDPAHLPPGTTPPIVPGWEWNGTRWRRVGSGAGQNGDTQGGNGGQGPGGGGQGPSGGGGGPQGQGGGGGGQGGAQGGGGGQGAGPPGGDIKVDELRSILQGYGLNARAFDHLIHEAVAEQWTPYQFESALYASAPFHKMFPGIFDGSGGLKMTPGQYLNLVYGQGGYRDIAQEYGISVNRRKLGQLIEGNVSPDEFVFRAQLRQTAKENEPFRTAFNEQIAAAGGTPLDQSDWFGFLAGQSTQELENLWEAASLRTTEGLTLTAAEANAAAGDIGKPGERVDMRDIVNQARSIKDFIAPELQAAGLSDADLVVLESGADPKNLGPRLEQIVKNRKALLAGPQTRLAAAGGGLYPTAREGF